MIEKAEPEVAVGSTYLAEAILKEMSDVVNSIDDVQKAMGHLVELATTLLGVSNCSLVLIEPNGVDMKIRAAAGLKKEVVQKFAQRVGDGITGHVAATGKSLLIEDLETHPLFARKSSGRYSTKSLLSVPLIHKEKVIGVLNVNNKRNNVVFNRSDELLLSVLANLVVIAIDKAQMRGRLVETERYEAELRVAREIQEMILARKPAEHRHWEFAVRNEVARSVAGDFFDAIPLPENRVCVVMGDVCGKGVPAALYMARVLSYFRVATHVRHTATEIMSFVSDLLAAEWSERTFVTASLCVLDNEAGKITFCSAGHPEPLLLHASSRKVELVDVNHGLPLGIREGEQFDGLEVQVGLGDMVVLYTDGVTEATNAAGEMFRQNRLQEMIEQHSGTARSLLDSIIVAVEEFVGGEPRADDVTLLAVRRI